MIVLGRVGDQRESGEEGGRRGAGQAPPCDGDELLRLADGR